jgi:DNA gyrase subunit A
MNYDGQKIIPVDIEKEMKKSYLDYSMSVIVGRALPDVRDGLKPVHRRILYTMYENGLTPDKAYRKAADTVGSVLGRYHPHGDASVYDALVRMAQDFSLRYPLVDGHGNFGSVDGDPAAAYRYTEARMTKIAVQVLDDIEKETVDFTTNYDDRLKEPIVLPCRFPNLLVNGSSGIAVGMATNIPPHNLGETVDAMACLIDNPEATLEDIMQHIKGPDFPTGGIIMGYAGIRQGYTTGRGKVTLRSKVDIEEHDNRFRIIVTEIPYMVNKARMIEHIADLVKEKRIEGISDLRDESDRDGMRIVFELKRDANPQVVLNQLYSYSQMQDTISINMLSLVNGEPKVLSIRDMLYHYIKFQQQVVSRRTQFELRKAQERAHILEGLRIALDFIDEVIAILRASKTIPEGKEALMARFSLTEIQAQAIVQMRLGQLTGLEREKIEDELALLQQKISEYLEILSDEKRVLEIVKKEALEIKAKYGDERRTEIVKISGEVDVEDLIPVENCVITLTHYGYIKRQPVDTYRTQRRGGRGISGMTQRDEDFVEELFVCSTHDFVLFFTNSGRVYRLKGYEIPESSRTAKGMNIANLLPITQEEKITAMIKVQNFDEGNFLVMVTRNGTIKRTELSEYRNARKAGLIAIILDEDDELAWVRLTDGTASLAIGTRGGKAIRFMETDTRPMGRSTHGVRAIRLGEGDIVVGMSVLRDGATLLSVTENGYGKRTNIEEYRMQYRGGKGIIGHCLTDKTGLVAGIKAVDDTDDLILIASDGVIIRIPVSQISTYSRNTQGVKLMRVDEGSRLVTVARAPHEEEEIEDEEAEDETVINNEDEAHIAQEIIIPTEEPSQNAENQNENGDDEGKE